MKKKYEILNNTLIIIEPKLDINIESTLEMKKSCLYYENKKLLSSMYYHKDLLHGPSIFYSNQGIVLSTTWFYKGKRYGEVKKYYKSSHLYSSEMYKADVLEGKQIYYFEDGSIKTIMNYQNGRLHGEVKLFFDNSQLKRHLLFDHGKKTQDNIFDERGSAVDETSFTL